MNTDIFTITGTKETLVQLHNETEAELIEQSSYWQKTLPVLQSHLGNDYVLPILNDLIFRDSLFNFYEKQIQRGLYRLKVSLNKGLSIYEIIES